jgi:CRISPR-associated endoribonuclease Cas6
LRIKLELEPETGEVIVPLHYNHMVQACIYRHIDPDLAAWLHDRGYVDSGRPFKLFTFSRLMGNFRRVGDHLIFRGQLSLFVGSPLHNFVESLAQNLVRSGRLYLGDSHVRLSAVTVEMPPNLSDQLKVRALSPITVYSTLERGDGRKLTYYYSPWEEQFNQQIETNLKKKYQIIEGIPPDPCWRLSLTPIRVGKQDQVIVVYKGTVIKGWTGIYLLQGSPQLMDVALQAGVGSKNSQGFGMVEALHPSDGSVGFASKSSGRHSLPSRSP